MYLLNGDRVDGYVRELLHKLGRILQKDKAEIMNAYLKRIYEIS